LKYNSDDLLWKTEFRSKFFGSNLEDVSTQYIYKYDERDNAIERATYRRNTPQDSLKVTRNIFYHHDENNHLESVVIYEKLVNSIGWSISDSIHLTRNNEGDIINKSEYVPVTNNIFWKNYNHDYIYSQNVLDKIIIQKLKENGDINPITHRLHYRYQDSGDIQRISGILREDSEDDIPTHYHHFITDNEILYKNVQYPVPFLTDDYEKGTYMILEEESAKYEDPMPFPLFPLQVSNVKKEYFYSELNPNNTSEVQNDINVNIFPIPASDHIYIVTPDTNQEFEFSMFDLNGKLILQQKVTDSEKVALSKYSSGVYTYSISNKNRKTRNGRIVITK